MSLERTRPMPYRVTQAPTWRPRSLPTRRLLLARASGPSNVTLNEATRSSLECLPQLRAPSSTPVVGLTRSKWFRSPNKLPMLKGGLLVLSSGLKAALAPGTRPQYRRHRSIARSSSAS